MKVTVYGHKNEDGTFPRIVYEDARATFEAGFVFVRDMLDFEKFVAHNAGEITRVTQTEDDPPWT